MSQREQQHPLQNVPLVVSIVLVTNGIYAVGRAEVRGFTCENLALLPARIAAKIG